MEPSAEELLPSGASTGEFEALELRDSDKADTLEKVLQRL